MLVYDRKYLFLFFIFRCCCFFVFVLDWTIYYCGYRMIDNFDFSLFIYHTVLSHLLTNELGIIIVLLIVLRLFTVLSYLLTNELGIIIVLFIVLNL